MWKSQAVQQVQVRKFRMLCCHGWSSGFSIQKAYSRGARTLTDWVYKTVIIILKSENLNPKGERNSPGKGQYAQSPALDYWSLLLRLDEVFGVFPGTELDPQVSFTIQSTSVWHFCEHYIITIISILVILSSLVNLSLCLFALFT